MEPSAPPESEEKPPGNLRFEADLDDAYQVEVAGCVFRASEVLWALDKTAYREKLRESHETTIAQVVRSFPQPIAYRIYAYLQADSAAERFDRLRDAWETTIALIYAIGLAVVRTSDVKELRSQVKREHLRSKNISDRISVIEAIVGAQEVQTPFMDAVAQSVSSLRDLNRCRNSWSHRARPDEFDAAEDLEEVAPLFVDVLDHLRPAFDDLFVWRFRKMLSNAEAEVDLLHGDGNPRRVKRPCEVGAIALSPKSAKPPTMERQLFVEVGGRVISLWPFALWDKPAGHAHPQILLYKLGRNSSVAEYSPTQSSDAEEVTRQNVIQAVEQTFSLFKPAAPRADSQVIHGPTVRKAQPIDSTG